MSMHTKITWTESIADGATENHYFDFAQIFSKFNRKQYHQVDGKGNAQIYLVKIDQMSNNGLDAADIRSNLSTAPNTYVTKQAVKAWHKARHAMYAKAGVAMKTLSPYTRNLRMELDTGAPASGTSNAELISGSPELSTMVNAGQFDESNTGALTGDDMVDTYTLHLLDDHVVTQTAETTKYTSVGVNQSWLDARRKPYKVTDASLETGMADTTIQHGENPLFEIRALSGIAEEIVAVAQDEQIQPPPWADSTQTGLITQAIMRSAANSDGSCIIEVPCGLLKASITDLRSTNAVEVNWNIELLDIYDM
jgi:hypothetical protein